MGVGNQSGWRFRRCEVTQGAAGVFHHFLSVMYAWGRGWWQSRHTHTHTCTHDTFTQTRALPPSSRLFHLSPCYFPMNMWIELTELYDGAHSWGLVRLRDAGVPVAVPLGTILISCGYVSLLSPDGTMGHWSTKVETFRNFIYKVRYIHSKSSIYIARLYAFLYINMISFINLLLDLFHLFFSFRYID